MDLPWLDHPRSRDDSPAAARRLQLVPVRTAAQRQPVEDFIRQRFAAHYGARIRQFMPCLLGLEADDGSLHGAVGFRGAESGRLFLERYLDHPIERTIARHVGNPVMRDEIVEVGNLAADGVGTARLLIVALTRVLAAEGFRWVSFTGTPSLINSFHRLGLALHSLGAADPARMGAELADWGRYYDTRPQVMVGEVPGVQPRIFVPNTHPTPDRWSQIHVACS